ncbi:MAG: pyrimidine dimer DNA glycosylase/endonuclease V [Syntrophothermus sp.]
MVNPELMCDKHLLGEHGELHKFLHNWQKQQTMTKRILDNAIEPKSYKKRHDQLAAELLRRNFNHQSPIEQPDFSYLPVEEQNFIIDVNNNYLRLVERCEKCRKMKK